MNETERFDAMAADPNESAMDIDINFGRIFRSLWHFAWIIVALSLLGGTVMYAYTKLFVPEQYESTASLYIHDKNVTISAGAEEDPEEDGKINYNTIGGQAATYLQNTYKRTLVSDATLNIVISNLNLSYGAGTLRKMIKSSATDYPYFDITVTSTDPVEATRIANELTNVLYQQVDKIVGGSSLTHVDTANLPLNPVDPGTTKKVILGMAAGFALACAAIVVLELVNNKIYDDDYLISTYGICVLASITDCNVLARKSPAGYKRYGKYENAGN